MQRRQPVDIKRSLGQGIRRVCEWIVRRGAPDVIAPIVITPLILQPGETEESVQVFDLKSHVIPDELAVRSDGSSGESLHAARYDHGLWHIAWSDGRLGVEPDAHIELIGAQAALTRQTRIARVDAELAAARALEDARKGDSERASNDWQDAKSEHGIITARQRRDPGSFSRILPFVYMIFAAFILVADLPLSLLVAQALGFTTAVAGANSADLLVMLTHASSVWEALAVSLGIAALTVAFKLLIDRLHVIDDVETTRGARIRAALRVMTLLAATAAAIYAFAVMGDIRANYMSGGTAGSVATRHVFIALAILFPVVAAFCLSLARVCSQNAKRLKLAEKARDKAWARQRMALQPFLDAQATRMAVQARRDSMNDATVDETFLRELYTHAYERGWAVPETRTANATLYERCEHLMHRALARIEQLDH
jgi:hypothetical protein